MMLESVQLTHMRKLCARVVSKIHLYFAYLLKFCIIKPIYNYIGFFMKQPAANSNHNPLSLPLSHIKELFFFIREYGGVIKNIFLELDFDSLSPKEMYQVQLQVQKREDKFYKATGKSLLQQVELAKQHRSKESS